MNECPRCHETVPQVKAGITAAGSQCYRCTACRDKDTPTPQARGYPPALHRQGVQAYVDGRTLRPIARPCGLVHQTVATGVAAPADALPAQSPQPERVETAELDDLYTVVGATKTSVTS